jgi:hypothetical protein
MSHRPWPGKHDALGQYPPPAGGARYDSPPTFDEAEWATALRGLVTWARALGAKPVCLAIGGEVISTRP